MVGVSASVSLPLHHKVQKFSSSSGIGSPGLSRKNGRKMVVMVVVVVNNRCHVARLWTTTCDGSLRAGS